MRNFNFLSLAVGLSLALWACSKTSNTTDTHTHEHNSNEVVHTEHTEHTHEAIELNQGEKWKVNEEMKPFVMNGQKLVHEYIQNKGVDYVTLAKKIKEQNTKLIKSCTMDGKSHDELHKWLHPHLEWVESLEKTTDAAQAQEIVNQLEKSYQEYANYFQ